MIASPVKTFAVEQGLNVATPEKLKDPDFLNLLKAVDADVICVVAFRILPEAVYTIPKRGSFNLHGSLLPKYRGAAPIQRAVMAGEKTTGVTTFFLKKKVDTGDVIFREEIPIGPDMTAGELHDVMMDVGAGVVARTLAAIESGDIPVAPQDDTAATPAPKIFREDCLIDWNLPAEIIHNFVRGLSPYPAAYTTWGEETLKVLRTAQAEAGVAGDSLRPGEIRVDGERLYVGTGTLPIELLELQRSGRKAMATPDFLRGTTVTSGEILGS